MGTDKRERQKAARYAKISQETAAAKKQRTFHTARNLGIAAVVILGGAFAYSTFFSDDDSSADDETSGEEETTTTLPPETTTTTIAFSNPELAAAVLEREPPDPEPPAAGTASDALEVTTLIEGEGEGAEAGDTLTVHYYLKTPDPAVYQSSWESGQPFPLVLGEGGVIPGWDEGLVGAKVGERRRMVIGYDKAYQDQGQGDIPPNTPLAFEVDIVDITPAG